MQYWKMQLWILKASQRCWYGKIKANHSWFHFPLLPLMIRLNQNSSDILILFKLLFTCKWNHRENPVDFESSFFWSYAYYFLLLFWETINSGENTGNRWLVTFIHILPLLVLNYFYLMKWKHFYFKPQCCIGIVPTYFEKWWF